MKKERCIAVIDLKAFYSYVECIDRGLDPFTTPLVVADKERGKNTIILSVTPYLKSRGVPSRLRIQDLPKGYKYIYAVPRMSLYIEKSVEVMSILLEFVSREDLHIYSIDEAFLDLTTYLNYYKKEPIDIVIMILDRIKEKTGLMATAGIGENFFLSKVALDVYAKKEANGIAILKKEEIPEKLWTITPLTKIWGIGERTEIRLNNLGIYNVKQLAHANRTFIRKHLGIMGEQLLNHANGIDDSDIREEYVPNDTSLSIGQTLMRDYNHIEAITLIREMCDDLAERMRREKKKTNVVFIYVGYASNKGGFARSMSLIRKTDDTELLFKAIKEIYDKYVIDLPIRRLGISFSKLEEDSENVQLDLFEDEEVIHERKMLQKALDELHLKFGKDSVLRASSLLEESTIKERLNQIGGHRK